MKRSSNAILSEEGGDYEGDSQEDKQPNDADSVAAKFHGFSLGAQTVKAAEDRLWALAARWADDVIFRAIKVDPFLTPRAVKIATSAIDSCGESGGKTRNPNTHHTEIHAPLIRQGPGFANRKAMADS